MVYLYVFYDPLSTQWLFPKTASIDWKHILFSVQQELDVHIQLDKCQFTKGINMNVSSAKSHVEAVFIVYRLNTYSWSKQSIVFLAQVRGASNPPQYQNMPTVPIAQPAIMQPTQEIPPPPYTKTGQQQQPQVQQQFSTAEFQVIGSSWEWRCEVNRYPDYCLLIVSYL